MYLLCKALFTHQYNYDCKPPVGHCVKHKEKAVDSCNSSHWNITLHREYALTFLDTSNNGWPYHVQHERTTSWQVNDSFFFHGKKRHHNPCCAAHTRWTVIQITCLALKLKCILGTAEWKKAIESNKPTAWLSTAYCHHKISIDSLFCLKSFCKNVQCNYIKSRRKVWTSVKTLQDNSI